MFLSPRGVRATAIALLFALVVGCGPSEPTQPTLSDEQVKNIMQQGKQQHDREGGRRGSGGVKR